MASSSIFSFAALFLIASLAMIDLSVDACAPTSSGGATTAAPEPTTTRTGTQRRKRSIEDDVNVVVLSTREFQLSRNEENMKTVELKLKEFADKEGISFKQLQELPRTSENVGGRFGVHFTVEGAFEKCARVLQFIQSATNEIEEMVSGTVKCGEFDAVNVTKKSKDDSSVLESVENKILDM